MKLTADQCTARLAAHDHGVLSTVHPDRGVDAIPVVHAVTGGGHVGIPIDNVKPKTSTRLQRERNLEHDPRATLLAQGWDPADWSKLWWVRAHLHWVTAPSAELTEELSASLAAKYPQYADRPFADVLVFRTVEITGWSAAG